MRSNKTFENIVHGIFLVLGLVTVACVLLITVYLVISGIPAIMEIGLGDFLFGKVWDPAAADPRCGCGRAYGRFLPDGKPAGG